MPERNPTPEEFRRMVESYTRQMPGTSRNPNRPSSANRPSGANTRNVPTRGSPGVSGTKPSPAADLPEKPEARRDAAPNPPEKTSSLRENPSKEEPESRELRLSETPEQETEPARPERIPEPPGDAAEQAEPKVSLGEIPETAPRGDGADRFFPALSGENPPSVGEASSSGETGSSWPPIPTPDPAILEPRPRYPRQKPFAPRYYGPIPPDKDAPDRRDRLPPRFLPDAGQWGLAPPWPEGWSESAAPNGRTAEGAVAPPGRTPPPVSYVSPSVQAAASLVQGLSSAGRPVSAMPPFRRTQSPFRPLSGSPEGRNLPLPGGTSRAENESKRPLENTRVGYAPTAPLLPDTPPPPPYIPPYLPEGVESEDVFPPRYPNDPDRAYSGIDGGRNAVPIRAEPVSAERIGSAPPESYTEGESIIADMKSPRSNENDSRRTQNAGIIRANPGPENTDCGCAPAIPPAANSAAEGGNGSGGVVRNAGGLGQPFSRRTRQETAEADPRSECPAPGADRTAAHRVTGVLREVAGRGMTDQNGAPLGDDQNSQTVGREGPTVLSDVPFLNKMAHFDRERIPERVVHAKGAGAFGVFESCGDASALTSAAPFRAAGKKTRVLVRFSTVIGSRGSPDTARDPRGFAVRMYTEDGNFDLVGNNIPVFFIRDAIQFPDLIHSLKPDPVTNLPVPERFWDFMSLTPEATHMITWVYSDYGTLDSFRFMNGFGVSTFLLAACDGTMRLCKFHWLSRQGIRTVTRQEAARLAGVNPDVASEDLYCAIRKGEYPRWDLCVQTMTQAEADRLDFDPLDDTKVWDESRFPLQRLGTMTLNRNPENFFAQVEQAAFCPANLIPGVSPSADKMLTGRTFSYTDTQRHRIGANFAQLPVNQPLNPPMNNMQDGPMSFMYLRGTVNYSPNSLGGNLPAVNPALNRPGPEYAGCLLREATARGDDFSQAGQQFRSYSAEQREHLVENMAVELCGCAESIVQRVVGYCSRADAEFGIMLQKAICAQRSE